MVPGSFLGAAKSSSMMDRAGDRTTVCRLIALGLVVLLSTV
jgi:hypothetical protein